MIDFWKVDKKFVSLAKFFDISWTYKKKNRIETIYSHESDILVIIFDQVSTELLRTMESDIWL